MQDRLRVRVRMIYTCQLYGANAFDYLNQLQLHASDVAEHPNHWMSWNYRDRLAAKKKSPDDATLTTPSKQIKNCTLAAWTYAANAIRGMESQSSARIVVFTNG